VLKSPERGKNKEKFIYTKDEIADMIVSFEEEISCLKEQLQRTTDNVVRREFIIFCRNLKNRNISSIQTRLVNESFLIKTQNVKNSDLSVERQANARLHERYQREHQK
jgi:hypothetical protein